MKKQILAGTLILTLITAAGPLVRGDDDAKESRKAKRAQKEEKQKADTKPRREKAAPNEQARGTRQQVFARYDRNKNGALDENEKDALRADFQRKKHPLLAKLDANTDGKIDDKELNVLKGGQTSERAERPAKRSKEAPQERKKARQQ